MLLCGNQKPFLTGCCDHCNDPVAESAVFRVITEDTELKLSTPIIEFKGQRPAVMDQ